MQGTFEVAGGSILGRNHARQGKNNQDAYYSYNDEWGTIAVVCDGCGSGSHSEVGAKLGAQLIVKTIAEQLKQTQSIDWERLKWEILDELKKSVKTIVGENSFEQTINNYFLFTVVGALVTSLETTIFAIGDGVIATNGKVIEIEPFPNNAPPYLAYSLLKVGKAMDWQIYNQIPTENVSSILIGTDGVSDLIKAEDCCLPGKSDKVGAIAQFWREDRYFNNPDAIRRKLSLINREVTQIDWKTHSSTKIGGLLPDDTTLIAIRRKPDL